MSKTQIFIEKARAVHGDLYDYSKAVYTRGHDKVIITCAKHGDFDQRPSSHMMGNGCAKCAGKGLSNEEWIDKCIDKHGETYLYDKTEYMGAQKKSIITCRTHGDFKQRLVDHCSGFGCLMCGRLTTNREKIKLSKDRFVRLAMLKHDGKYSYANVVYVKAKEEVIITCRLHGDFKQTPDGHLSGRGCCDCGHLARVEDQVKESKRSFVEKANNIHGNRYDYAKVDYNRARFKVSIICAEHGVFEQTPNAHLKGRGCPLCPARYDHPTSLYLMHNGLGKVKVGYSIDADVRISQLNRNAPFKAELLETWTLPDTPTVRKIESKVHRKLVKYHAGLSGFDGASEWFNTTPERAKSEIIAILSKYAILNHTIANQPQLSLF